MITFLRCLSQLQFDFGRWKSGTETWVIIRGSFFGPHPCHAQFWYLSRFRGIERKPQSWVQILSINLSVLSSGLGTLPLVATVGSEVPGEVGMSVPSGAPSLGGTTQPTLRPTNKLHRLLTGQIPAPLSHLSGNLSLGSLPKPNPFSLA